MAELAAFSRNLGYSFKNPGLLQEALTHRSAAGRNNERLEFLGDSILNFVMAAELFSRFPSATEGDLSRLRATLVKGDRLAEVATGLGLGDFLILGSGELKSGGFRRSSILADALEAVIGAVYLDADLESCRRLLLNLYDELLNSLPDPAELKDPKTRLQEWLQAKRLGLPQYVVVEVSGEAHRQHFRVSCNVADLQVSAEGTGSSRRRAEQESARRALDLLQDAG